MMSSQIISFQNNTDNPNGNTFLTVLLFTVTFALNNQQ